MESKGTTAIELRAEIDAIRKRIRNASSLAKVQRLNTEIRKLQDEVRRIETIEAGK